MRFEQKQKKRICLWHLWLGIWNKNYQRIFLTRWL